MAGVRRRFETREAQRVNSTESENGTFCPMKKPSTGDLFWVGVVT